MTGGGSVGGGFRLVSNEDINMGQELFKLKLEELRDERRRQVQDDSLSTRAGSLGDLESRLGAVGQKVALNVEELGARDQVGDFGRLEVGRSELLSGTESGTEGTVVAGDDDGTGSSSGGRRLDLVG